MQRIVINTDPGIDDAIALLYALCSPEAIIEAITSSYGNVPIESATQNIFEVLRVAGLAEFPEVAQGATAPALETPAATYIHGDAGLGGWTANQVPSYGKLSKLTAAQLIGAIA